MSIFNNILLGASAQSTTTPVHKINQSIRFNDDDSPYLSKAFSGAGDLQKATMSCWVKMGNISTSKGIFTFISDKPLELDSNNNLKVHAFGSNRLITDREFRDPSAWYHFVLSIDSTQAVSSERIRLYVNGQRETSFSTESYPSQNTNGSWWSSNYFQIGRTYGTSNYMDGYLAEIVYIDGTALDPSSFGEYNSSNIWVPKDVSGLTFGTNGFHIKGEDASDLGNDSSSNNNDFTTSGLASHDQVSDSPTNNFAVANPLDSSYYMGSETFSEGNLQMTLGSSVGGLATMGITSGKWYAEFEVHSDASGTTYFIIGIYGDQPTSTQHFVGYTSNSYGYYALNGNSYTNFTSSSYGNSYTVGDVVGVAVDLDNNKLYFSKNGTFQNSGDPTSGASGTGAISINPVSSTGLGAYFIASSSASSTPSGHTINYNFGQDGTFAGNVTAGGNSDGNGIGNFKYSVPSGYKALCTKNLGS